MAVFVVFGPHVVKVGHFFDGVTYGGIARQMSMGIGTLDCPQYSPFFGVEVLRSPPDMVGLASVVFCSGWELLVGEGMFLLVNLALHGLAFRWVWNEFRFSAGDADLPTWRVVVALYLTVPVVRWAWSNNMLEIGVSFFSLLAVGCVFDLLANDSITGGGGRLQRHG